MKAHHRWAGLAVALSLGLGAGGQAHAQALTKLEVLVFSPPSLSAFLPPIIKAQKFDQANGLDLSFPERTPDAYTTQFFQDQRDGSVKLPFFIYLPLPRLEQPDERQIEPPEEPQP